LIFVFLIFSPGCTCFKPSGELDDLKERGLDLTRCTNCNEAPRALIDAVCKYWLLRKEDNFAESYKLEAPHIQYQFKTPAEYRKFFVKGMSIKTITLKSVEKVDEKLFKVNLIVVYDTDRSYLGSTQIPDKWIKLNGGFRHTFETLFGFIQ